MKTLITVSDYYRLRKVKVDIKLESATSFSGIAYSKEGKQLSGDDFVYVYLVRN
jgi:hypothetical protein